RARRQILRSSPRRRRRRNRRAIIRARASRSRRSPASLASHRSPRRIWTPSCRRREARARIARVRVPVLACLLSACVSPQAEFPCTDSCECMLGAEQGTCEPTGFCSFDSEECKSGRRYGDGASSDLRDACVGGADAIYVAPTGSDSAAGDAAAPLRHLSAAAAKATAGTTIVVG